MYLKLSINLVYFTIVPMPMATSQVFADLTFVLVLYSVTNLTSLSKKQFIFIIYKANPSKIIWKLFGKGSKVSMSQQS